MNDILNLSKDIKFMQILDSTLANIQSVRPVKNAIYSIANRAKDCNAAYIMLEYLYIIEKRSNLTKSQRETICNIVDFAINEYKTWKNGTENN
jgi:hypothetical protein